jgi:hypothetical protein
MMIVRNEIRIDNSKAGEVDGSAVRIHFADLENKLRCLFGQGVVVGHDQWCNNKPSAKQQPQSQDG